MQKLIVVTIATALFLAVLFLDQNRSPVPVKIILGDPVPIGLSTVIVISLLAGALLSVAGVVGYKVVRRNQKNRKTQDLRTTLLS